MLPPLIVMAARMAGLDVIAVTDHNSCENAGAVIEASAGSGLRVLPGLEVQSAEGAHVLCIFDELNAALKMQEVVYASLSKAPLTEKMVAEQMIVDSEGEFVGYCSQALGMPSSLSVDEIFEKGCECGGIVIPAHIDRPYTGICSVLGWLPETPFFPAVEVSANKTPDQAREQYAELHGRPVFRSSDAHWLSAIGERRTVLHAEHRSVAELGKACAGEGGRRIEDA